MSGSDAIIVGEGWISEHYFTTEAKGESFRAEVKKRRDEWDAEAKAGRETPRSRFVDARQKLEAELAKLAELLDPSERREVREGRDTDGRSPDAVAAGVHRHMLDVLELRGHGLVLDQEGPLWRVSSPGITDRAPLVVVSARPVTTVEELLVRDAVTLPESVRLTDDGDELKSAARLVSALFVADDAPDLILVLAGRWALLAERERWAEGRYLAVDVQLVCERNDGKKGGEIDRALTCLCAQSIAPDADGKLWWHNILEASVKHTVGVSKDLRDGVRLSIEIIANEVVNRRRDQGLDPLPAGEAQPLAKQSLRFLYRILFLLYAEASPELGVLPVGAPEYDQGYSLDRLRELVQVELATPRAQNGTHLYDSLGVLFRLVDLGHSTATAVVEDDDSDGPASAQGLTFNALKADLFRPEATAHIDAVGLGNQAMQKVLSHLLLSKEARGKDRGFISYAELGINQLGAVYEGLMSYTGFFAETDLYEVAKNGDASKGSWVVPAERAEGITPADFVKTVHPVTGELQPVVHEQGSFVFRLAGRERQQSASYYTPEVLTRFTVGQALEELLDQDGQQNTAAEILEMTVCEPALGSGAFAIEAVRQLAEQYLKRRQVELGERIDPDAYPRELQKVKAYIALHNVYGVDLNATAVELAEISLWLDTMVDDLSAPWFGLHLRRGNSLVGARRAVYRRSQVSDKSWLSEIARELPLTALAEDVEAGRVAGDGVHHFLLPAEGWGAAADAKEAAAIAPDAAKRLKNWRRGVKVKPARQQVEALVELAHRVEVLWQITYRRLQIAQQEIRRAIPVWGKDDLSSGGAVQREQIETELADVNGSYQRLRRVMDAWTALWFWPLTDEPTTVDGVRVEPPTWTEWIAGLRALLGRAHDLRPERTKVKASTGQLSAATDWEELSQAEQIDLGFAHAKPVAEVLREHPWLVVCERVAEQHGFFHWHLDFVTVFAKGGFDLQVGNPPWVRPRSDVDALLAEGDPWWQLETKPTQVQIRARREATLALPGIRNLVIDGTTDVACLADFAGSAQYPHLQGLQPDLYRCFMEQAWRNTSKRGMVGLIHLESHLTDEKAGLLRAATYQRLRRHWEFINELKLFEIQDQKHYGVNIYGPARVRPHFINGVSMYHPDTVVRSLNHDGSGPEPGLKDPDGNWDLRPHRSRITVVNEKTLASWHAILESSQVPVRQARMVYAVNRSTASVLDKLSHARRVGELGLHFSRGWDESIDRKKGYFESEWGKPDSWNEVILQGPHLFVATPFYKSPNKTMLHQQDWSVTDFETLPPDAIPVTAYKPVGDQHRYDRDYTHWGEDERLPARGFYRVAWRKMAANTGERTLIASMIPPGTCHIDGVFSLGIPAGATTDLVVVAGFTSSLILDFVVRVAPKANIRSGTLARLPLSMNHSLQPELVLRSLRLNCVTNALGALWGECYSPSFRNSAWVGGFEHARRRPLGEVGPEWSIETPLRIAADRRRALVEIDALVALMLGLTADELCTIYRTQFAVLHGYDRNVYYYDTNGRLVPNSVLSMWRKKGSRITEEERTATNQAGNTYTYELPFATLDREKDMRQAYAHFERLLTERS
ncbi:DNA methyltransferase [Micromonospora lupini]|uniref:site-specific DNA-methyltransferase (adenine-specific) n=1 Tax=Micromonospora lupini str. Lupac 08 TaxID=1150864 RepID=I0KXG4_9ACTN|nr:DNA methyltransferase [Micromonospora lupini]CCH16261.1 Putative Type II restriction enzyme, methylase subunit [Micromonospora lupini str. Lupac 08]